MKEHTKFIIYRIYQHKTPKIRALTLFWNNFPEINQRRASSVICFGVTFAPPSPLFLSSSNKVAFVTKFQLKCAANCQKFGTQLEEMCVRFHPLALCEHLKLVCGEKQQVAPSIF